LASLPFNNRTYHGELAAAALSEAASTEIVLTKRAIINAIKKTVLVFIILISFVMKFQNYDVNIFWITDAEA
jgi:hypothetical protein